MSGELLERYPPNLPQKVRSAFYAGLARECLDWAWLKLDEFRQKKPTHRLFRGEFRERTGVPLQDVANLISRSSGELSRWTQGQSPSWSNLALVMTALSADWPNLDSLPEKVYRRSAGCMAALRIIRRLSDGQSVKPSQPAHHVIRCLDALFADDTWAQYRRFPDHRATSLQRIAATSQISEDHLDNADREWGDSFMIWLQVYANSLDEQIWQ